MAFVIGERFRRDATKEGEELTLEREWTVFQTGLGGEVVASTETDIFDALADAGIAIGTPYAGLAGVKLYRLGIAAYEDSYAYSATGSYRIPAAVDQPDDFEEFIETASGPDADNPNNPFGPEIDYDFIQADEYRTRDRNGKPFVNSAGQPISPTIPTKITISVANITVVERTRPRTSHSGLVDSANPGLLLAAVRGKREQHVNKNSGVRTIYYRNTYVVMKHPYNSEYAWEKVEVLDAGFMELKEGKLRHIADENTREPLSQQSLLDGNGKRLASGAPPVYITFTNAPRGPINVPFLLTAFPDIG